MHADLVPGTLRFAPGAGPVVPGLDHSNMPKSHNIKSFFKLENTSYCIPEQYEPSAGSVPFSQLCFLINYTLQVPADV